MSTIRIPTYLRFPCYLLSFLSISSMLFSRSLAAQDTTLDDPPLLTLLTPLGSWLDTIPPDGAGPPTLVRGRLDPTHHLTQSRHRVVAWQIHLHASQTYQLDLTSQDFDPYLYVLGPDIPSLVDRERFPDHPYALTDDDGGEGLNARICFTSPATADYVVVVAALAAATGNYSLRAIDGCPASIFASDERLQDLSSSSALAITIGDEIAAVLADATDQSIDRSVQEWSLEAPVDSPLSITLHSDDFDPYLVIFDGQQRMFADDDSGAGNSARLALEPPTSGPYRIFVTSFQSGSGQYRLAVLRRAPPP